MKVIVSKYLNVRVGKPSVNAPCYQYLAPGSEIEVDGKQYTGDKYEGLDIWMKDGAGNYYWSGGIAEITTGSQSFPLQFDASKVAPWSRLNFEVSRFWNFTTGKNITVALIDTGIFPHSDIVDSIDTKLQKSFVTDTVTDTNGHGTHIAGIIAARGKCNIIGIAPDAIIIPIQVQSENVLITNNNLIKAIEYATSLSNVDIINISLSPEENDLPGLKRLIKPVQDSINAGKIIVIATGNKSQNKISSLADIEGVIAVSSVDLVNTNPEQYKIFKKANISNRVTTCCPGVNIRSCKNAINGTVEMTGTSFAAAYLSGLIALKLQLIKDQSPINQKTIVKAIQDSVFQIVTRDGISIPVIDTNKFLTI